jgi:hypothetical protein
MSDEKKGAVLTGEEINEIARLDREATAAPWFIEGAHMDYAIMGNQTGSKDGWAIAENVVDLDARRKDADRQKRDADLILALRNAAPSLLAAARLALDARAFLEEHGEAIGGLLGSRASTLRDLHGNFTGARIVDGHAGALSALLARFKDAGAEARVKEG